MHFLVSGRHQEVQGSGAVPSLPHGLRDVLPGRRDHRPRLQDPQDLRADLDAHAAQPGRLADPALQPQPLVRGDGRLHREVQDVRGGESGRQFKSIKIIWAIF